MKCINLNCRFGFGGYTASGERGIRYVPRQQEGVSSGTSAGYAQDMDIMLYPNALITVRPQELPEDFDPMRMHPEHTFTTYTKHYYIGSERINSKLGTVNNLGVLCEEMEPSTDLINDMNSRTQQANQRLNKLYQDLDKELEIEAPYLYSTSHSLVCGFKSHDPKMYDAYWYHPDHLGSSSFITNTTGEISQHLEYLPFGETLVEEHLNSYNSPFKFNGKEYDAETGNYYYGARYMNPKWSMWLGVDPLAEKYPSYSSYNYTLNNPINLVDPDGRAPCPPGVNCLDPLPKIDIVSPGASGKRGGTFGYTRSGGRQFHSGIDLRASKGTNLISPLSGTVVYAKNNHSSDEYSGSRRPGVSRYPTTGYGNSIVIEYTIENGFNIEGKNGNVKLTEGQKVYIRFTHMDNIDESLLGENIKAGALLGQTGATGNPGLHDGIWGIEKANRHTHMEVSTSMSSDGLLSKEGMIDARIFIKSDITKNGSVIPQNPPPVDPSLQGLPSQ